jgi:putative ubiquitin-RnfH superfamily antitoxin RatB of RatAB toxin-antitoxin module
LANLSEADLTRAGIFGKPVATSAMLRDGDRVEIYRPLKIDPKEARRRRAEKKR